MRLRVFTGLLLLLMGAGSNAAEPIMRVGVLEFGTVNWELDVIREHGLDRDNGFRLEVTGLGSKNATAVALQSGAVDMIVTDFVWVARQRERGLNYVFYPHSTATGAVMTSPQSGIDKLQDLAGRGLGIAGGPVDKSWLLLQAYYRQRFGRDLANEVETHFAAPPLLNKLIERDELPAVLNFWHYSARLSANGMRRLIGIEEVLRGLGIEQPVALIGWVFADDWARSQQELVDGFLRATRSAKQRLLASDAEWQRLAPKTRALDQTMLIALRDAYRAGVPAGFDQGHRRASAELYRILAEAGGEKLVGAARELPAGVFWSEQDF